MIERFLEKLRASLDAGIFAKLTLSRPRGREGPRNIYARVVELKAGTMVSFTIRHATRDLTQNEPFADALALVARWIASDFEEAHLFTLTGDWRLRVRPGGEPHLRASRPTFTAAPPPEHDHAKPRAVANAPFLVKLGVTTPEGTARPGMADKLRQVERFVEILGHLVEASPLAAAREVHVCDMGAGKGYLTFAVHEYFSRRGCTPRVVGVEQRMDLVEFCNGAARELSFEGLTFVPGTIDDYPMPPKVDILIALHACDTATDAALAAGVRAGAALIVTAPCCHKEVRQQLTAPPVLADVLRHGILAERQAEILTDGLRAMALEASGYEAKVFEFISSEHTGKNLMISATHRRPANAGAWTAVREAMREFGIERQRLVETLEPDPAV